MKEQEVKSDNFDKILKRSCKNIKKSINNEQVTEQERIINKYDMHITMLGILDYQIDKQRVDVAKQTQYDNLILQKVLLKKRKKLTEEIIENIQPVAVIKNAIETYPSYSNFFKLYEEIIQDEGKNQEIFHFINAYNIGYSIGKEKPLEYNEYKYEQATREVDDYMKKKKVRIRKK